MASKYELSIAKDYVSSWGVVEGVRELFQNALDQETVDSTNKMFFDYNSETETLSIGNLKSILEIKTLLLGTSSKKESDNTIGQFGEGYKVGTLALIRAGKQVVFKNYGMKQVWKPRFVNSRRYGTQVLTFFVETQHVWNPVPHHNLVIEISGITEEEYESIAEKNLHINKPNEIYDGKQYGQILLDDEHKGKIYVNGLYVDTYSQFHFGYNLNPMFIKLDRDRRSVRDFDLRDKTSYMWGYNPKAPELVALINASAPDTSLLEYNANTNKNNIAERVYEEFKEEHGENAIPITCQSELIEVQKKYPNSKAVLVKDGVKSFVTVSSAYNENKEDPIEVEFLSDRFDSWLVELTDNYEIEDELIDKFEELLEELREGE